ncbi:MAG: lysophospholipid acyltransferase family protein [Salegentibacter sp.]
MQALVFWLAYPLLWLISILPFRLFYLVSDFICFLVYRIFRYRRKTVTENLKLIFPEKPEPEILSIRRKFYSHMCDMFLEMIKSMSISSEELKARFIFTNPEEIKRIEKLDKSLILMCGHYASYEWMIALQLYDVKYRAYGIYKKIKNPYFDDLVRKIRGRFEGILIPTVEASRTIAANEKKGNNSIYDMIADQSPKWSKSKFWTEFMNIEVPVFAGSEKLARDFDMAVAYLHIEKVGRGRYHATLESITNSPREEPEFYVTKRFFEKLENQIRTAPEYYLWTHKRWKHRNSAKPKNAVTFD